MIKNFIIWGLILRHIVYVFFMNICLFIGWTILKLFIGFPIYVCVGIGIGLFFLLVYVLRPIILKQIFCIKFFINHLIYFFFTFLFWMSIYLLIDVFSTLSGVVLVFIVIGLYFLDFLVIYWFLFIYNIWKNIDERNK